MSVQLINTPTATPSQPVGKILLTSGSTTIINAPAGRVFDIITGFSKYHEWNTWTPALKFDTPDADVQVGAKGTLQTEMKDQGKQYMIPVEILELKRSSAEYALAWQSQLLPWWSLGTERVQVVTPVQVEGKDEACEVRQWESMSGVVAYALKYLGAIQSQLDESNLNYLQELKAFAESA